MHERAFEDQVTFRRGRPMRNRFALAPLTNWQSHDDGTLSDEEHDWLVARAAGGFGMTMTCAAYVSQNGKAFPGQLGISDDAHLPGLTRLATSLHDRDSMSVVQLFHGGLRAQPTLSGEPSVAPWHDEKTGARELTTTEIANIVEDFVAAAVRAEAAGFDGVEVHGGHGYLLCQTFNAERNCRTDAYGGSYENRMRMTREIIAGVRSATSKTFNLGLRLSPERHGVVLDEMVSFASEMLVNDDLDYLDMSLWDVMKRPHGLEHDDRLLIDYFTSLPRGDVRLGVAGKIRGAASAQWVLDQGVDIAFIGRAAIVDHDFATRALTSPGYESTPTPVTREHLAAELVSERFIDYLESTWPDFVST